MIEFKTEKGQLRMVQLRAAFRAAMLYRTLALDLFTCWCSSWMIQGKTITKTRLFKYIENFTTKNWKFSDKNSDIFFIFLLKT